MAEPEQPCPNCGQPMVNEFRGTRLDECERLLIMMSRGWWCECGEAIFEPDVLQWRARGRDQFKAGLIGVGAGVHVSVYEPRVRSCSECRYRNEGSDGSANSRCYAKGNRKITDERLNDEADCKLWTPPPLKARPLDLRKIDPSSVGQLSPVIMILLAVFIVMMLAMGVSGAFR